MKKDRIISAIRSYKVEEKPLFYFIIEQLHGTQEFLQSEYLDSDYSRNALFCPKALLHELNRRTIEEPAFIEQLRLEFHPGLLDTQRSNLLPVAFPERLLKRLLQEKIYLSKSKEGILLLYTPADEVFATQFYREESREFRYFEHGGDIYALSMRLGPKQMLLIDECFESGFMRKLGWEDPAPQRKRRCVKTYVAAFLKMLFGPRPSVGV